MPGANADDPEIPIPPSESYPGLSQFDIPLIPIILGYEDTPEGILVKVHYDITKTHRVELFQNIKKDKIVHITEWQRINETRVSNVNPVGIIVERPDHRFCHYFMARCVTEHGIYSPYSRPVGYDLRKKN